MTEETLFQEALARSPQERAAFLEQACAGRPELRAEVEALLAAHEKPSNVLDKAPAELGQTVDSDVGAPKHGATGEYTPEPDDSPLHPPTRDYQPQIEPGLVIAGRYTLQQKIGEGGMGDVWVAKQTEPIKRKVALKLIKTGMDSKAVLARFEQERLALGLMDHPNIARVLDGGMTPTGQPFFVMELVNGLPLTKFCDEARLTPKERLELFVPICQAVQHAHQKGIVHRDLKPANILVTMIDGRPAPKVIDFGVAKATAGKLTDESLSTQFGAVVGTLEYMSPEQAGFSGDDIDTRADIYSLGVILYELLTGLRPIDAKRLKKAALTEMVRIIREEEPSKPSTRLSTDESLPSMAALRQMEPKKLMALLRGELDWVVMKCLEKQRERRYETANALSRDIQRYLADEVVEARPPSAGYRFKKFVRRHKGQVIAASLVLFALLAGIAGTTFGLIQAEKSADAERLAKLSAQDDRATAVSAADAERLAKLSAQKDRAAAVSAAEAERQAKLEAINERANAEQAAAKEKTANAQAQKRLKQVEMVNVLLGSIFENLDPSEVAKNERPLQAMLVEKLDNAVAQLEGESIGDPLVVAGIQNRFGKSLYSLGEPGKAVVLLERAYATHHARFGPEHPHTLTSMGNLASAYEAAGKSDLALPLHEATVKLRKAKLGLDHPDTLVSMGNLAAAYHATGNFVLALPLQEETFKRRIAKLGADHPDTLQSMNNLAEGYRAAGKLDLSVPLHEETFKLRKAKFGLKHPDTLTSMGNLAAAYQLAGKLDLALPLHEQAFKLQKARLGAEHPSTIISMSNLALAYKVTDKLDLALPLFEDAHKLLKAKFGPEHPTTLKSTNNLANAYQAAGKLDQALPLHEMTLKLMQAKLGPDHPDTLNCMHNLAKDYQTAGKLDLALPLAAQTLKLAKASLGLDHPHTFYCMNNMAECYQAAGKLYLALPLFEETLKRRQAKLGPDHTDTLSSMNSLAVGYWSAKRLDKSVPLFETTLKLREKKLGRQHPDTLHVVANLGVNYRDARRLTEALPLLEEAYRASDKNPKLRFVGPHLLLAYVEAEENSKAVHLLPKELPTLRKVLLGNSGQKAGVFAQIGQALLKEKKWTEAEPLIRESLAVRTKSEPNSWATFNTQSLLGGVLLGQKKYADAEPLLLKGFEGMKLREQTIPPAAMIRLSEAAQRLVELCEATGKKEDAVRWRQEKERYAGKVVGAVHEVGAGLKLKGNLDAKTLTLVYQVKLAAGKTYVIHMLSPNQAALDPFLVLTDAAGKKLAQDDDGGGGLNARITFRANQDGTFHIQATSFDGGRGDFTVSVLEKLMQPKD